jgi:ATP-dependent protease HslVU (ClpYQ) peptidase subunit
MSAMSIIAALHHAGRGSTWIGSDTLVCSGSLKLPFGPKWVVRRPWAIGIAGHLRAVNVVDRYAAELTNQVSGPYELADRLRDLLKRDGFREGAEERGPLEFGQTLLLAHADGVWTLGSDFSTVAAPPDQLWAEGSGRDLAIGAAYILTSMRQLEPAEIVRRAIETAVAFDVGCGGHAWVFDLAAGKLS